MDWLPRSSTEILPEHMQRELKASSGGAEIRKMGRATRRAYRQEED